eukprot:1158230-Pelagomonas_calceolata.AAC.7
MQLVVDAALEQCRVVEAEEECVSVFETGTGKSSTSQSTPPQVQTPPSGATGSMITEYVLSVNIMISSTLPQFNYHDQWHINKMQRSHTI